MSRITTLRQLRLLHRHVSLFFAPATLFFSVTGAVQTLGWHELPGGATPGWLAAAALLHKHQRLPAVTSAGKPATKTKAKAANPREHILLKAFVVLLGTALAFSAMVGAMIALLSPAMRRAAAITLAAGTVAPAVLLFV